MDKKTAGLYTALMKVLDEGTFPLKAREVPAFYALHNWAKNELPELLTVKEKPKPQKVKKKVVKGG